MSYKYDESDNSNLIEAGDYEAYVDRMEVKTLPSGKDKLSIMFRIRSDIEGQKYGNKCVFDDIWKTKDDPEHFNLKRINQLLSTQEGLADGQVFDTIDDICKFMIGKAIVVHVAVSFDDYWGEDRNKVSYYKKSKNAPQSVEVKPDKPKGGFEANGSSVPAKPKPSAQEEDDDELPF